MLLPRKSDTHPHFKLEHGSSAVECWTAIERPRVPIQFCCWIEAWGFVFSPQCPISHSCTKWVSGQLSGNMTEQSSAWLNGSQIIRIGVACQGVKYKTLWVVSWTGQWIPRYIKTYLYKLQIILKCKNPQNWLHVHYKSNISLNCPGESSIFSQKPNHCNHHWRHHSQEYIPT